MTNQSPQSSPTTAPPPVEPGRARLVRSLAAGAGALFLVLGAAGFVRTGWQGFASDNDMEILGLEVNPLHNLVHLVLGAAGLLLCRTLSGARGFGWLLAVVSGCLAAYGVTSMHEPSINLLSMNGADVWLHAAGSALGLVIALLPVRRGRPDGSALADEESAGRWMAG